MIVIDASVAVKWLIVEVGSESATALLKSSEPLFAPDLMLVEVGGAVVRQANERKIVRNDASTALARWAAVWGSGRLQTRRLEPALVTRAAELALDLGHPLKDCIYLALAIDLGCALLTADAKFQDRAADRYPDVRLLG